MKGISHFTSGLAFGTFIYEALQLVYMERSFIVVLGGVFGLLPDFLDFRFARFIERFTYEVEPDHFNHDPWKIAQTVAKAIDEAGENPGKKVSVKFYTVKYGPDSWRQYSIWFDPVTKEVRVKIGPIVTTAQVPLPGSEPSMLEGTGSAKYHYDVVGLYSDEIKVDIFSGPSMTFYRHPGTDEVEAMFIEWHRRWSHAFTTGAFLAGILALIMLPFAGIEKAWIAFRVSVIGYSAHVIEDQMGHLGSNLFWPFTKFRTKGFGWWHASDALPNFGTVTLSWMIIIWNVNATAPQPAFYVDPLTFFGLLWALPFSILVAVAMILRYHEKKKAAVSEESEESKDQMEEIEVLL